MKKPPDELKRGPKFLRDWLNEMRDYALRSTPLGGIGTSVTETPNGVAINTSAANAANGQSAISPFQLLLLNGVNEGDPQQLGVYKLSPLFNGVAGAEDPLTITGLLTSIEPTADDANAFALLSVGQIVYLEITITGGTTISTVEIKHGAVWTDYPDPVLISASAQTKLRVVLAEATDFETDDRPALFTVDNDDGTVVQYTQMWNRPISLIYRIVDGTLSIVPADFALLQEPANG